MPVPGRSPASGARQAFRALSHRNFRLFIAGQLISLVGTWMQRIALSWLVFRLTGSTVALGTVSFAGQLPTFLLAPFAGVLADRWHRHRLVVATQVLAMVQALALAALVLLRVAEVWQLLALSALLGVVNAVDLPARQAFLSDLLEDRADLSNAIALNSTVVNAARLIGPSVAGLLVALVGEGLVFLANGLSYLAVLAALLAMRLPAPPPRRSESAAELWGHLHEGLRYSFGFPPIRAVLLLLALVSLMGMPYAVLMPVFATRILHGGPSTLGLLMSSAGAGALAGALYLASRTNVLGLGRLIAVSSIAFGLGLVGFAFAPVTALACPLLAVAGFGMMVQMASSNTVLQTIVEDGMRGRVMSLYTVAFMGVAPFGSLFAGGLAAGIGAQATVAIGGATCILGGALFARQLPRLRELVRPIYVRRGILPVAAEGVQSASELTRPPEV